MAASTDWLETSRFAFTIPAGFDLEGVDASGVKVYRYNYWQTFPIDKP